MPNWISGSKDKNTPPGVWTPAKEKTVVTKTSSDGTVNTEIYEGDDRAAVEVLKESKLKQLGTDAKLDPQVVMVARQNNMTVDEWIELHSPPKEELDKEQEVRDKTVVTHAKKPGKRGVRPQGGGAPSGPDRIEGAFTTPPKVG